MYMKCHMGCNKSVKVTGWYTGIGTCIYCVYTIRLQGLVANREGKRLQGLVANKKGKGHKGWWPIRRERSHWLVASKEKCHMGSLPIRESHTGCL